MSAVPYTLLPNKLVTIAYKELQMYLQTDETPAIYYDYELTLVRAVRVSSKSR